VLNKELKNKKSPVKKGGKIKKLKIMQLSVLPSLNKKKVIFNCCAGGPSHVHNDPVRFDPGQSEDQRQRVRRDGSGQ
jgi:hypothetical protein